MPAIKSIFEDPQEESRYLKFLMKEKYKIFEDNDQNEKRLQVLNSICALINEWQVDFSLRIKKMQPSDFRQATVHSFGSFKMGVHFPQTDMDLICVFPAYITKDDFFSDFMRVLSKNVLQVEEVIDVIDSRVPILKLKYMGFQIDLLYASISIESLDTKKPIDKILKDEAQFNKLCVNS
jgi:poly(A) polymerase